MRLLIAHQIEGRTRLRAASRPVDAAEFEAFADRLAGLNGVEDVDWRAATGSLVVEHPALEATELAAGITQIGGALVAEPQEPTLRPNSLMPVRHGLDALDGMLSRSTAGGLDMRTLVFATLVGLALRQLMQGQVMVPAISLLGWAFQLLPASAAADGGPADGASDGAGDGAAE